MRSFVARRRLGLSTALAAMPAAASAQAVSGIPFVVDGDTLGFGEVRVRLYGIDAPRRPGPCAA